MGDTMPSLHNSSIMVAPKGVGGSKLTKELQAFVAVVAYDTMTARNSMKEADQCQFLEDKFHGTGSSREISLVEQCIKGIGPFGGLYTEQVDIVANPTANASNAPQVLAMKSVLFGEKQLVRVGEDITVQRLSSKSAKDRQNLAGRTILAFAKDSMQNCRKALSIISQPGCKYRESLKSGHLPSGETWEDYIYYIRTEMYKLLNSSRDDKDKATTEDGDEAGEGSACPSDYLFRGFFAFALLGPVPPQGMEQYQCKSLLMGDIPGRKTKSNGRAELRKQEAKARDLERKNAPAGEHGLSHQQHMQQASFAQTNLLHTSRNQIDILNVKLEALKTRASFLSSSLKLATEAKADKAYVKKLMDSTVRVDELLDDFVHDVSDLTGMGGAKKASDFVDLTLDAFVPPMMKKSRQSMKDGTKPPTKKARVEASKAITGASQVTPHTVTKANEPATRPAPPPRLEYPAESSSEDSDDE